jgi:tetratricopeptide (TPR) repeat protein
MININQLIKKIMFNKSKIIKNAFYLVASTFMIISCNDKLKSDTDEKIETQEIQKKVVLADEVATAETYLNKGISKQNLNDYQGAIVEYTKAIKLNTNYAKAYNNRGVLKFYFLKDKLGACEDARKAEILGFDASNLIKVSCD